MEVSLESPLALCERLGLRPTIIQELMLKKLADQPSIFDTNVGNMFQGVKAVVVYALWRMLIHPDSRCTVISSNDRLAGRFTTFMRSVTMEVDPALASVCTWSGWNAMGIGNREGGMRLTKNNPACVQGFHCPQHTVVILGAGSTDEAFVQTREALQLTLRMRGGSRVSVW